MTRKEDFRKQYLHEDIRDWGQLIILIFASIASSTTSSNNHSELKYSISSSPFRLRDFLRITCYVRQQKQTKQTKTTKQTNKNRKKRKSLHSSSYLNRAILSSRTLHRKANKPITLNTSEELWIPLSCKKPMLPFLQSNHYTLYLIHTEAFIVLAQNTLPAIRTGLFTSPRNTATMIQNCKIWTFL